MKILLDTHCWLWWITTPEKFIPPRLRRDAIKPFPINHMHALHVASLPLHHRDPFDRLLISQAQMEHLPIMTVDKQFEAYEVELIWGKS